MPHEYCYSQKPVEMKLLKYGGYLGAIAALLKEGAADDFDDVMITIANNH